MCSTQSQTMSTYLQSDKILLCFILVANTATMSSLCNFGSLIVSFELNTEIEYAEDQHHWDKKPSLLLVEPPSWPNGAMDDNTMRNQYEEPWMRSCIFYTGWGDHTSKHIFFISRNSFIQFILVPSSISQLCDYFIWFTHLFFQESFDSKFSSFFY